MGRPKANETTVSLRLTDEATQLLATLATANGQHLEDYLTGVLHEHLATNKTNPALAGWYAKRYPLLNTTTPPAADPAGARKKDK